MPRINAAAPMHVLPAGPQGRAGREEHAAQRPPPSAHPATGTPAGARAGFFSRTMERSLRHALRAPAGRADPGRRARSITSLPPELVDQILGSLDQPSLKAARQTCRAMRSLGARWVQHMSAPTLRQLLSDIDRNGNRDRLRTISIRESPDHCSPGDLLRLAALPHLRVVAFAEHGSDDSRKLAALAQSRPDIVFHGPASSNRDAFIDELANLLGQAGLGAAARAVRTAGRFFR